MYVVVVNVYVRNVAAGIYRKKKSKEVYAGTTFSPFFDLFYFLSGREGKLI